MLVDSLMLSPPQFWHLLLLADAGAPAILADGPLAVMLADAGSPAVLADAPDAAMLADARAPAVLAVIAWAPLAVMLAGAGAPAVPASAFAAVMLTDAGGGDGAGAGAREAARQVPRVPRGLAPRNGLTATRRGSRPTMRWGRERREASGNVDSIRHSSWLEAEKLLLKRRTTFLSSMGLLWVFIRNL